MKTSLPILILFFVIQLGYSQAIQKFLDDGIVVDKNNVPLDSTQGYFPVDFFHDKEHAYLFVDGMPIDSFLVNWYSKHLYSLNEPLLYNKPLEKETYRFTWLRTFHNPIAIRIEKSGGKPMIHWKVNDGTGGYEPDNLTVDRSKSISLKKWNKFKSLLQAYDFWAREMPKRSFDADGSEWILEGNDMVNYRAMSVWSPSEGAYFEACIYLIDLTKLRLKKSERY